MSDKDQSSEAAEEYLQAFGERLPRMLDSISDAFFAVDRSWEVIYVNKKGEELLRRSRDKVLGRNLWDIFPDLGDSTFEDRYRKALEKGETTRFEAYYPPQDTWYGVSAHPYENGLLVYFNDITGSKQMEQTLRESEARVRAILETTVDGIITIDEYGHIETFNQAAEKIFGYEADEIIGENVKVLMPNPYRREHDDYLENYRQTGHRKIIGIGREVTGQRKDGTTFPMDLAVSEVTLDDRTIFTGIVRDISEQRRLEHEILQISEQERRRIGQDLHDGLGQMLTGIGLISRSVARQMEERNLSESEDLYEIAELIKEADQYARTLSRGLVPVDLDAGGLAAALDKLSGQVERLFGIKCIFEERNSVLVHDNTTATHLFRIAQEAVSNAAKHGRAAQVHIQLAQKNGKVHLDVVDDGIGLPRHQSDDQGMGIRIMRYRARIVGGTLNLVPGSEGGTIVQCKVPQQPALADSAS